MIMIMVSAVGRCPLFFRQEMMRRIIVMIVIVSDSYSDGDDDDDHGVGGITGCQMSPLLQTAVPQGQTSL